MDNYTIGQYQYNVYFGEDGLSLKAINYDSLVDYRCDIKQDDIKDCNLINSLTTLHKILVDSFTNNSKDTVKMNIKYNKTMDEIDIVLKIVFAYAEEEFKLKLISVKDLVNQEIINNKMQYFNKRLIDVEGERKEIDVLRNTIYCLESRLSQLEKKTIFNNHFITYPTSEPFIPASTELIITPTIIITGAGGYDRTVTYLPYIDINYYIQICNCLFELKDVDISGLNCSDLKFINNCVKITTLSLSNMSNLMDLSAVLLFPNLKTLTIEKCRKINNLKILEKCKNLELLKIHSSINTGIFSEIISFRIVII